MRLERMGLRTRIYVGFGMLIVLGLGMAAFGAFGLSGVTDAIGTMGILSTNVVRVEETDRLLEVIRRAQNRYRIDADKSSLADITDAETHIAALMTEATHAVLSEERRKLYAGVTIAMRAFAPARERFIAAYDTGFAERAKLVTGGDVLTAATGRLVEAVRAGDNEAAGTAADRVETTTLLTRVANWRFLATLDRQGVTTFKTNAGRALAALDELGRLAEDQQALIKPVHDALASYVSGFEVVSAALLQGNDIYEKELRPRLLAMQKDVETAQTSLKDSFAQTSATSFADAQHTMWLQFLISGLGAAAGIVAATLIGRGIVRPIIGMTDVMTRLAAGNHDIEVPGRDATNEIGAMARAIEVFKQHAAENDRMTAAKAREQAARDRRQAAMDRHTADFGATVSGVMESLVQSSGQMRSSARGTSDAAKQTRDNTSSAVEGARNSSRDLNAVAVATEEMAASVSEISKQVAHVTTAVRQAVERASETDTKVAGLAEAADRIGDVVRLITDIAGQTNLLALNATIEAARAGEAGKGFAVVAGEVKALAAQTARATDQIGAQIVAIRTATIEAVTAVRDVGAAIGEVSSVATAIAAAVEQQAAATQEISGNVQQVTLATAAAAQSMEEVLAIAGQTDAASGAVLAAADEVSHTADMLHTEVNDFLAVMTQRETDERRAYERIPGAGTTTSVSLAGRSGIPAVVQDISRGGAALLCDVQASPGIEVQVDLAPAGRAAGRTVRSGNGVLVVAFRQDRQTLTLLDRAMEAIAQKTRPTAA
ncbi:MAG: HAMP domain-containing methyl-accepting chemotaxis protein [Acetobacteraceae bacterium]|nr:HAMP domain-containing methyl-accepting chemotaxis protein [Acetobacteraceae bacterium]